MGILQFIKSNMQFFAGGGLFVVTTGYALPHTILTDYIKSIYSLYEDGKEKPINDHTKKLAQKVLDQILLKPEEEADIKLFTLCDQDPSYWGSTKVKGPTVIGLPGNFDFKSTEDINKQQITLGEKRVPWESDVGQKFQESLVLSDEAKLFAIARQLSYCQTHHVYSNIGLICGFSVSGYWAGRACNTLLGLERRTTPTARGFLYSVIGSISFTLYLLLKDTYTCRLDRKADEGAAKLGYAKGGVEYYTKVLQRNKCLREMLGEEGAKIYTAYGNKAVWWRQPNETFSARLDKMKIYLSNNSISGTEQKEGLTS